MTPEQEQSKAFIEAQLEALKPIVAQSKIMQHAWAAGGELCKPDLEAVTKFLGSRLAVEEDLKTQLEALDNA